MKAFSLSALTRVALATACVAGSYPVYGDHAAPVSDPANQDYPVPATTYNSVFPATGGAYLREVDRRRLPWHKLFDSEGRFVPEPVLRGETSAPQAPAADTNASVTQPPGQGSDMRAVIRSIDAQHNRVRLQHGPIERLGMPGMTMMFRVKDPTILRQVKEGDEVGVTVEMQGSRLFITGFQE